MNSASTPRPIELTLATNASGKEFSRPRRTPIRMKHLAGGGRKPSGRCESYQTSGGGTMVPTPFTAAREGRLGRLHQVDRAVDRLHLEGTSAAADGAGQVSPRHAPGHREREVGLDRA